MSRSLSRAVLFVLAAVFAALTVTAGPASADTLNFSDPSDGSIVKSAPEAITLVFGATLDPAHTQVTVSGPHGQPAQLGAAYVDGLTASLHFTGDSNGLYTVNYSAVAQSGGSPITGAVHFTLAAPPPGAQNAGGQGAPATAANPTSTMNMPTGTATAQVPASTATASASGQGGGTWWPWLAIGAVVLAAVAVVIGRRRRAGS
jgi:methionine-rich copper-binding protein CopC